MLLFLIAACRSILEMLTLCLVGQAVLALLCGSGRERNPVYRLFALITRAPRRLTARLSFRSVDGFANGMICLLLLLIFWVGLAWMRKFI